MANKHMVLFLEENNINFLRTFRVILAVIFLLSTGMKVNAGNIDRTHKGFATGSIGNLVWFDRDRDGRQDLDEPGIRGVEVVLFDAGGSVISTVTTDSIGMYLFNGLDAGTTGKMYELFFKLPAGFKFSPKAGVIATPSINSDADEITGKTGLFLLIPGETNNDVDAGMVSTLNGTLPLHTLKLTASLIDTKVNLKWVAENEMNTNQFSVQRSFDGVNYSDIGSKVVTGQINTPTEYDFITDIQGYQQYPIIYYRIKAEDNIQRFAFSNIAPVRLGKTSDIKVWPSPFLDNISISYNAMSNGKTDVRLIDHSGRILWKNFFDVSRGTNQLSIGDVGHLLPGVYFVIITDRNTNQSVVQKLTK